MDLMSVTTDYAALLNKYSNFNAPSVEMTVGSTKLVADKDLRIVSLDMELTCGYESSGCVFELQSVYDYEQTDFSSDISCIQIGEKVEIAVGYVKRESVFQGYIDGIEYGYGMDNDTYSIRVECKDIKGLLMKNRRLEFFTEKSANGVVQKLLGEAPVSSYLAGKEIDSCSDDEVSLCSSMMTDYDLIVEQASKQGFEFFILQGKAYFRQKEKVTSVLMELSPQQTIRNARLFLSGQSLVKKVEVRSIDRENGQQIKGEASIAGTFSSGSSSKKLMGESRQVFYEPGVRDANEAKQRAEDRMRAIESRFGELECECVGIPELAPGRFVKVKELSSQADKKYYVRYVRHVIDETGYRTYLKAGLSSL